MCLCVVEGGISIATQSDLEKEEELLPLDTLDPPVESHRLAEGLRFMLFRVSAVKKSHRAL